MALAHEVRIVVGQTLYAQPKAKVIFGVGPYEAVRDTEEKDMDGFPIWVISDQNKKERTASIAWFVDWFYHMGLPRY